MQVQSVGARVVNTGHRNIVLLAMKSGSVRFIVRSCVVNLYLYSSSYIYIVVHIYLYSSSGSEQFIAGYVWTIAGCLQFITV